MAVEDELAEVVENYVEQLRAMKRPAKEEINMLTMVAEQYMDRGPFALGLVQALERAIEEVTHNLFVSRAHHILLHGLLRSSSPVRPLCALSWPNSFHSRLPACTHIKM